VPLDTHVPDPVVEPALDPEQDAVLTDAVSLALLVVLDALTPAERLAFVLHDVFAMPFTEIGPLLDRSPAAAKQLPMSSAHLVRPGAVHPGRRLDPFSFADPGYKADLRVRGDVAGGSGNDGVDAGMEDIEAVSTSPRPLAAKPSPIAGSE
jgi:hypothetical protein